MTAAKPTIDECIARAERDVDLAAGWLAADKDDADARQNYQHCVAVRDFLRAHKRITESVSEQILQNQLAEADRRAAERDAAVNVLKAEGIRPKGKSCLPYIIRAITAERQLARETARADAWVKEVRDLARELGIADEDSNGSIHDWRHVKYKLRQLAELQAEHDALVKDAARYRWLCDNANLSLGGLKAQPYIELDRWALMGTRDIDLDAAIDAAMSAVALKGGE